MSKTNKYNIVVQNTESTVVAEYSSSSKKRAENYQSESELEKAFIKQLQEQAYEYIKITTEEDLILNLRNQLEKLNNYTFSDKEASGIVLLKTYNEYYNGYEKDGKKVRGYRSLVKELQEKFPIGERILGEQNQKDFIKLYGSILRVRNILTTFDEFEGNEILTERDVQDYHSLYIDLYNEFRKIKDTEKENINDDIIRYK